MTDPHTKEHTHTKSTETEHCAIHKIILCNSNIMT